MKFAASIAFTFVCILTYAQSVTSLPKSESKRQITEAINISKFPSDAKLGIGKSEASSNYNDIPHYSSTTIYSQVGDQLIPVDLRVEDYHALQVLFQQILDLNERLSDSSITQTTKVSLLQQRETLQSEYNTLLVQSISNAE